MVDSHRSCRRAQTYPGNHCWAVPQSQELPILLREFIASSCTDSSNDWRRRRQNTLNAKRAVSMLSCWTMWYLPSRAISFRRRLHDSDHAYHVQPICTHTLHAATVLAACFVERDASPVLPLSLLRGQCLQLSAVFACGYAAHRPSTASARDLLKDGHPALLVEKVLV